MSRQSSCVFDITDDGDGGRWCRGERRGKNKGQNKQHHMNGYKHLTEISKNLFFFLSFFSYISPGSSFVVMVVSLTPLN